MKIWQCKIGEIEQVLGGSDLPMREAVCEAYRRITDAEPLFLFSGWGAELTEPERAVVENRLPAPRAEVTEEEIKTATALNDYLLAHEQDIAHGINDFGNLRPVFQSCIQRDPASHGPHSP
jgi:hypothetical protein